MKFLTLISGFIFTFSAVISSAPVAAQESASSEIMTKCGNSPAQPNIPNGTKASMDEMVAAQSKIKAYQADSQTYRSCIDSVMATWDSQSGDTQAIGEKKEIAVAFYNRSVSDEEDVANLFNTALRAFKGKQ